MGSLNYFILPEPINIVYIIKKSCVPLNMNDETGPEQMAALMELYSKPQSSSRAEMAVFSHCDWREHVSSNSHGEWGFGAM